MIYLIGGRAVLCCEICGYPIGREPVALYSEPSGAQHFPLVRIVCGEACSIIAEDRLTAGPVKRLSWEAIVAAITGGG